MNDEKLQDLTPEELAGLPDWPAHALEFFKSCRRALWDARVEIPARGLPPLDSVTCFNAAYTATAALVGARLVFVDEDAEEERHA